MCITGVSHRRPIEKSPRACHPGAFLNSGCVERSESEFVVQLHAADGGPVSLNLVVLKPPKPKEVLPRSMNKPSAPTVQLWLSMYSMPPPATQPVFVLLSE